MLRLRSTKFKPVRGECDQCEGANDPRCHSSPYCQLCLFLTNKNLDDKRWTLETWAEIRGRQSARLEGCTFSNETVASLWTRDMVNFPYPYQRSCWCSFLKLDPFGLRCSPATGRGGKSAAMAANSLFLARLCILSYQGFLIPGFSLCHPSRRLTLFGSRSLKIREGRGIWPHGLGTGWNWSGESRFLSPITWWHVWTGW